MNFYSIYHQGWGLKGRLVPNAVHTTLCEDVACLSEVSDEASLITGGAVSDQAHSSARATMPQTTGNWNDKGSQ